MSARVMSRVCSRPTDEHSLSTNDCTPRLTRFTPQRSSDCRISSLMVPGAHSTVISAAGFDLEVLADRLKDSLQLVGREHRRRATAEVNRIYLPLQSAAELPRDCLGSHRCRNTLA